MGYIGHRPRIKVGAGNPESLKYGKLWEIPQYRETSPGESVVQLFLSLAKAKPMTDVIDFGCGTGRAALLMAALPPQLYGSLRVTMIDFVRNSLDPEIQQALETQKHMLRFVKHDLEQPLTMAAPLGFCADVMEHIPPDRVDQVLDNILHAAEHVFFAISTVPDNMGELIGETLHLTVQPFSWWLEKFQKRKARILWSKEESDYALFYLTAWSTGQDVVDAGILNVEDREIRDHVRYNVAQGWQQISPHISNDREVAILGGGPSLADHLDDLRALKARGVHMVTMNGTYHWALTHGLGPVTQIVVDARQFNARFTHPVSEGCYYLICSQAHPDVFAGLPRDKTFIWHTTTELIDDILRDQYGQGPGAVPYWPIPGGSTVLLRAIPLLRTLGYSRFHLVGCDSSLRDDAHHAYSQPENDGHATIAVTVTGGRVFKCHGWMLSQAQQVMDLIRALGDQIELEIYGDGLLAHMFKTAAEIQEQQDLDGDGADESTDQAGRVDEVVPGLWVGGWESVPAAKQSGKVTLGVRHLKHDMDDYWVPVLVGNHRQQLDVAADLIDARLRAGEAVYVHCQVGIERAPLTVAWYLHAKRGMSLDEAYALVRARHPVTEDRRAWVEGVDQERDVYLSGLGVSEAEGGADAGTT
jgi:protein-tyrosine phosphatase